MSKKTVQRVKHIPQRTCVGCRTVLPKRQLVRIVRSADGVLVDPTGKLAGRGAYLHDRRSCWEAGLKGSLAHALKAELTATDRERLKAFMETLREAEPGSSSM
ncbi:MAG TPA: YlxR family protein [Anaerolineales bacterium]|nr:YlxR family protein [Anaerolineales bacterium]